MLTLCSSGLLSNVGRQQKNITSAFWRPLLNLLVVPTAENLWRKELSNPHGTKRDHQSIHDRPSGAELSKSLIDPEDNRAVACSTGQLEPEINVSI